MTLAFMKSIFDAINNADEPIVKQTPNQCKKTRFPKPYFKKTNNLCKNNKYMRRHHSIKQPGIDIQRKTY